MMILRDTAMAQSFHPLGVAVDTAVFLLMPSDKKRFRWDEAKKHARSLLDHLEANKHGVHFPPFTRREIIRACKDVLDDSRD